MPNLSTGTTTIKFGNNLRIGYRVQNSTDPFTYLNHWPDFNELPYTFTLAAGAWEIEYTEVCNACNGIKYSDPLTFNITI